MGKQINWNTIDEPELIESVEDIPAKELVETKLRIREVAALERIADALAAYDPDGVSYAERIALSLEALVEQFAPERE